MAIKCVLKKSVGLGAENERVYPKAVVYSTFSNADFLDYVRNNYGVDQGKAKSVLAAVSESMCTLLQNGHNVQIDGLGTFSVVMGGEVEAAEDGKLKLNDATVRKVRLVPDTNMMKNLKQTKFELAANEAYAPQQLTQEAALAAAQELLDEQGFFIQVDFMQKTGASKGYTSEVLKRLVDAGKIAVQKNSAARKIYIKK